MGAGRIRLIILADEIPDELRRVVEYLNEKMADTIVLAVEVKRYRSENSTVLVATLVGATTRAREKKPWLTD